MDSDLPSFAADTDLSVGYFDAVKPVGPSNILAISYFFETCRNPLLRQSRLAIEAGMGRPPSFIVSGIAKDRVAKPPTAIAPSARKPTS